MGKRGVKPTPTSLKLVQGTRKSRVNQSEPKPEPLLEVPKAPEWMTEGGRQVWDTLVPDLHRKGLFTSWDVFSFPVFCEAVVQHRLACEAFAGDILVSDQHRKGASVKNPALQPINFSAQLVLRAAQEFGLTPSARSGIQLPATAEFEEARRLLS